MTAPDRPWSAQRAGLRLVVRVTPRASRTAIDGLASDAEGRPLLKVRLAAPPVDGAANAALVAWLADALQLRKADVTLAAGETSRIKRVDLAGDSAALAARLEELLA